MNMISSTSTTSTSGVMLMAACNLTGSPSRIGRSPLLDGHPIDFLDHDLRHLDLRYFEQAVHQLGRSPAHLDVESLDLAREGIEGDDGRDCDEDAQGRGDERLSDTARDHRHAAGPRGRDAPERVDDPDHRAEEAD